MALLGYAAFDAVFVTFAGLALNLAIRDLWFAFVLFLYCGLIGVSLVYWARRSRERPKSFAMRLSFAMFSYLVLFMLALEFSAFRSHLLKEHLLMNLTPWILPTSLGFSVLIYMRVRRLFGRLNAKSR